MRLAPDEQIEVFRIVQEGLANVRKHANAHQAEVVIGPRNELDVILHLARRIEHQARAGCARRLLRQKLRRNRIKQGSRNLVIREWHVAIRIDQLFFELGEIAIALGGANTGRGIESGRNA